MTTEEKRNEVLILRKKGMSYAAIGITMGISRQRVHQIIFRNPYRLKPKKLHFCNACNYVLDSKKGDGKEFCLNCMVGDKIVNVKLEGIDYARELVRIRDSHTCQSCGLKWIEGRRRFDVHHLDPEMESKKNYSYDIENHYKMITYCHRCHLNLHSVKEKMKNGREKSFPQL